MPRPEPRRPSYSNADRRRAAPRLPLSHEHTQQRSLDPGDPARIPVVVAKTPVRTSTLFRKRLQEIPHSVRHGDLVKVQLRDCEPLGYGLCNPRAEATVRMLTWGEQVPDASWWRERLASAVALRQELAISQISNAQRLIHAEGDGLPGLVADRYGDVLSLEAFSLGMYQRAEALGQLLQELTSASHWIVRPGPQTGLQEGFEGAGFGSGQAPEQVVIQEDGLRFEVDFSSGHKTGFFCDQRENRRRLQAVCRDKSVLDLCCYTGGFSLHAALPGEAREVIGVDLDEQAIETARRNARLNQARLKFIHADAFAYMRDMQRNGRTFDVVVLDPPKLIRGREEYDEGSRKYYDMNRLASSLVSPGGLLVTCSCSGLLSMEEFTRTVTAAVPFDRAPQLLQRTGAAPDHPVALNTPETEYLKALWLRLR